MRHLERTSMPNIKIAPSILACDFSRLGQEIESVIEAGADWIHVDVMDGHFTPNITIGPPVVAAIRKNASVPLDVHLMIEHPDDYIAAFANAGADNISFHIEATHHPLRTIDAIRGFGCSPGIVLNPATPEESIEFVAEHVDFVLVMTVNPGFGGQAFIPGMVRKIQNVRAMMGDRDVQVDGGIDDITAREAVAAGANVLVAGSYIYSHESYFTAIESLKLAAD